MRNCQTHLGCGAFLWPEAKRVCDEYEDERMKAFWRLLDERERRASLEPEEAEEPLELSPVPIPEAVKPKVRPLVR